MADNLIGQRWKAESFVNEKLVELGKLSEHADDKVLDFRGIPIGQHDSPPSLRSISFASCKVSNVDFAYAKITSRFNDAVFSNVSFIHAKLIGCDTLRSTFVQCCFDSARLTIQCNDAVFQQCSFQGASWSGSMSRYCRGKRVKFVECNFSACTFKQIELRATRFVNCLFEGATFTWCELAHLKFEGNAPSPYQFVDVDQKHVIQWLKGEEGSPD